MSPHATRISNVHFAHDKYGCDRPEIGKLRRSPRTPLGGLRQFPGLDTGRFRFLPRRLRADSDRQGIRQDRRPTRTDDYDHPRVPPGRSVHLRADGRSLRKEAAVDDRPRFFLDRRGGVRTGTELHDLPYSPCSVWDRHGWRMGCRRLAGDGESAEAPSWRAVRTAAGGVRDGLSAGGRLLFLRFSALGLAADVFHRWLAGAARDLRAHAGARVGGVAAHATQGLEQPWPRNRVALEAVRLPYAANGRNELRLSRHAGHVSDIPAARLGILSAKTCSANRILDGRRDRRRNKLWLSVRSNRPPTLDCARARVGDRCDSALGVFAGASRTGHRSVPDAVHGAGCMGRHTRAHHGAVAG